MQQRLLYFLAILIFPIPIYSQTEYTKHLLDLMKKSTIDSTYIFTAIENNHDTIISEITYYGKTNNDTKVFYIRETYPAVSVRHGFVILYLIDSNGKKYFYHDIDKPDKLENGIISFKNFDNLGNVYYFKTDLNTEVPLFLCQDNDDCYSYLIDDKILK